MTVLQRLGVVLTPCWYHRFGGETPPCPEVGTWYWSNPPSGTPGRSIVMAMRWCDHHRHATDVRVPEDDGPARSDVTVEKTR